MLPFVLHTPMYLWGFMGCGKSSLGRSLAQQWDIPFYETDALVEELVGESIPSIFQKQGELAFRHYEREVLYSIPTNTSAIVATGGGLPCFEDNAQWMRLNGFTIYLSLSYEELSARLERSSTKRPLLQEKQGVELRILVEELLLQRELIYRRAHLAIDANLASPEYLKNLFSRYELFTAL